MKIGWFSVAVLLFLGGCSQIVSDGVWSIDRVHVVLSDETSTLGKVSVVINDPSSVSELVEILDTAKKGHLVRDDELLLAPAVFYELYDGDELVEILMFNGEDTLRLFRGGLCFEVEYEGVTLSDWYKKVKQKG